MRWLGKIRHPCSELELSRMGSTAEVYIQADIPWLDSQDGQTNSGIFIHSLTHKHNHTRVWTQKEFRRNTLGPNDKALQELFDLRWRNNSRNERSALHSFPDVFGPSRLEDDISAVGGVLLRQEWDKKGPEQSGGPVWERHEKGTAPGSRTAKNNAICTRQSTKSILLDPLS